jgi:hypothetical protein
MIYGHNSNVKVAANTFHVQTEDRGAAHSLIDTTVYFQGRVLHRRTNNYFDLLPLNEDRAQALKMRLDEQHAMVVEEIRSGALQLSVPPANAPAAAKTAATLPATSGAAAEAGGTAAQAGAAKRKLEVEILNPKAWLSGKHVTLQIQVRENNQGVDKAKVRVEIEGSAEATDFSGETAPNGKTQIEFDMPRLGGVDAAMVIRAEAHQAQGQLRFALRAKPRVPAVGG